MALPPVHAGSTSVTLNLFVQDSSSTIGAGLNGLTNASSGLKGYYVRPRGGSASIGFASLGSATAGWTSGGFVGVDTVNMVGWYRLDAPDAAFAAGAPYVDFHLYGSASMAPCPVVVPITAVDGQNSINFGLSLMPANVTQIGSDTTSATNLKNLYAILETGTLQAGGTSTIQLRSGASTINNTYNNQAVVFTGGAGSVQSNRILTYTGATRNALLETTMPTGTDSTTTYILLGRIG